MLTKTIAYTDYFGTERTEKFYFNLSKAELVDMQFGTSGGLGEMMNKIVAAKDTPQIIRIFKDLILRSYGEPSADGKYFEKSEEISKRFSETEAYVNLYMELSTDDKKAAEFIAGIIPSDIAEKLKEENDKTKKLEVVK